MVRRGNCHHAIGVTMLVTCAPFASMKPKKRPPLASVPVTLPTWRTPS
ncbi:MAG: hypothetical protein ACLSHC_11330 [Bilophila wadsworthia]